MMYRRGPSAGPRWATAAWSLALVMIATTIILWVGSAPGALASAGGVQCGNAGPWCNRSLSPDRRAQLLMNALSESQRISLLAGNNLTGVLGQGHTGTDAGVPGLVPTVNFTDGTNGIRLGSATALPDELAVAATFDSRLARLDGSVLGNEAKDRGNDVIYAPTLTIMRTPLAGRTFQGLGEDPFLASQTGVGLIDGIQAQGVIADANIYVANNQEGQDPTGTSGLPGSPLGLATVGTRYLINANVGQRTLREIYLPPFEAAVKQAHVGTAMCAYNLVNGTHNCENGQLLNGILKRQWGFKGFVLSDYGAAHGTVASLRNGLDFEPWPGTTYAAPLVTAAVDTGQVSQAVLDDHVHRYLRTLFAFGVFDRPAYTDRKGAIRKAAHAVDARHIEEGAITLLRDRGSILPLSAKRVRSIAVIGPLANQFITGGGSSAVTPYSSVTPLEGIIARAGRHVRVAYNNGSRPASAAALAKRSNVAIVVAGDYEIEGTDLACLSLECPDAYGNQDALIRQVAAANRHTIVVLETGGPVLTPWRNRVQGLLEAWYPGEQGGNAIAHVLFGDVDPSGHLPATFPQSYSQEPTANDPEAYPGIANDETYREGVFVGYRWWDERHLVPAYPFGFGLAYTTFAYRGLRVVRTARGARISVTVTNTGRRRGTAVPQLYVHVPSLPSAPEPPARLAGFDKVTLRPKHSARVSVSLDARSLSYWDTGLQKWRVARGCYRLMVGPSSADLPLKRAVAVNGARCPGANIRLRVPATLRP